MEINKYILLPLEEVEKEFVEKGYKVKIIDNNDNVNGDTKLVTNITINGDDCEIFYGNFIFDVIRNCNDKKN